ncbi:MAG TPA: twin transmembrane helix small protein [Steroidobacteraceae bacterium]|nr:twin transmembrane helix small protein [Steroidobacteraceae bacterium]
MQPLIQLLVLGALAAIVASLGTGLYHLARGGGEEDSRKLARALTWRIALSIALFALLMLAWYFGLIAPHGVQPQPTHP